MSSKTVWTVIDDNTTRLCSSHETETGALVALTRLLFARLETGEASGGLRVVRATFRNLD